MQTAIDQNDPRSTAAAAILAAGDLARDVREMLPVLLGQRTCGGLGLIADRMERDLFDRFTIGSLEGLLEQCDAAVEVGTIRGFEWVVARSIGGDDELEPIEMTRVTPVAREIAEIADRLRIILHLVARTEALLAADRLIDRLR
jgi:hypothetical protein